MKNETPLNLLMQHYHNVARFLDFRITPTSVEIYWNGRDQAQWIIFDAQAQSLNKAIADALLFISSEISQ